MLHRCTTNINTIMNQPLHMRRSFWTTAVQTLCAITAVIWWSTLSWIPGSGQEQSQGSVTSILLLALAFYKSSREKCLKQSIDSTQDYSNEVLRKMMRDFPTVFHMHTSPGDSSKIPCKMIASIGCSSTLEVLDAQVWLKMNNTMLMNFSLKK